MLEIHEHADGAPSLDGARGNLLLAALPAADFERLAPDLEPETLGLGKVLYEPSAPIEYVHFVDEGLVSVVSRMAEGTVEVGTIGREGFAGSAVLLHADRASTQTFVQVAGRGRRIPVARLRAALAESPALQHLLLRYVQALFEQVAQTAACNRLHTLEARCARWLLMTQDRIGGDRLFLTQEFLSYMLGVHRPAVTLAAGALQKAGLIRYRRGRVTVVDRPGLEAAACACYGVTRQAMERMLADIGTGASGA
ncbi:MAG TPA: Crp/Fnr family transcriptional regulator [Gemmatimonadaceae bacterium]